MQRLKLKIYIFNWKNYLNKLYDEKKRLQVSTIFFNWKNIIFWMNYMKRNDFK